MLSRVIRFGGGGGALAARLEPLWLDLRAAARSLSKARSISVLVVATLALGIGVNAAIFSIVHTMLMQPLPYRDADRLVFVWLDRTAAGYPRSPMSGPDLRDLREGSQTLAELGAIWASGTASLEGDGEPEQLRAALVTTNFFRVLGVESSLGRTFREEDSTPGADPAILIGWDLFQRRFGGDPSIVGRRIVVNEELVTVIGVMPEHFRLLLPPDASVPDRLQAWAPFWPNLEEGPRRNLFLRVVGRMRPGVTLAQAQDDVAGVSRRIVTEDGTPRTFATVPLQAENVRELRTPLLTLFAGVGILLLVACVNVACLLLVRAASRARETATRLALGATYGRLVRLWMIEGLLLALAGAIAGLLAGHLVLRLLLVLAPESLERLDAARIDTVVLAYVLGISMFWGVLFSLAPALERSSAHAGSLPSHGQRERGPVRHRARTSLVVIQLALSLALLVSAGLLARGFLAVIRTDLGFRADHQLTFRLSIPGRYGTREAFNAFARSLEQSLAALHGVTGAGAISHLPYDDLPNWALTYGVEQPLPAQAPVADSRAVSPGLLQLVGAGLVEGRFFTEGDEDARHPVAIINERLARELWPGRSAVGETLVTSVAGLNAPADGPHARFRVVGVIRHLKLRSVVEEPRPQIFVPWRIAQRNPIAWVLKTGTDTGAVRDPSTLVPEVRGAVASLDPRLAIYDVRPMRTYVDDARSTRRFTVVLVGAFAATALALTLVGVYGVLAYTVALRRPEFGVRAALGADRARLCRLVLGEALTLGLVGSVIGLIAASAGARLLGSQLYTVAPGDPLVYSLALVCVCGGALAASWVPAWRATRVSPMEAMRTE